MAKDINQQPYDEATLTKLEIFEQYLTAWLPVFIQTPHTKRVIICDYFAGSGRDSEGTAGSPIRILQTIEKYRDSICQKDFAVDVILNETIRDKLQDLQHAVNDSFDLASWDSKVTISFQNEEFQVLFRRQYAQLKQQPNLLFIDQYGMKELAGDTFQLLIDLPKTDFLFFLSSSAMKRFAETPEFRAHFPDISPDTIANARYEDIHRIMLEYYRSKIPKGNATRLYPFTLKKGNNIYGLIFGSKHPLGVEKFLDVAWDKNKLNGEANFDIDQDLPKKQPSLFDSLPDFERPLTKRDTFDRDLEAFIREKGATTNQEVYEFTLEHGHPKSHGRECVLRLKREGKVHYKGNIGFSYASCLKDNPKPKPIRWVNHG